MRIIWTPLAIDRVSEIAEHIALDKPKAAARWLDGVFQAVQRLTKFPQQGHLVSEVGRSNIREIFYSSYRIIYRVDPKRVAILTVRHASRRFDKGEL